MGDEAALARPDGTDDIDALDARSADRRTDRRARLELAEVLTAEEFKKCQASTSDGVMAS